MLSIEESRIQDRKLVLWARFHPNFTRNILIPEIETNNLRSCVDPQLTADFQAYQFTENSLYVYHNYAYADIPTGQKYEVILRISNGIILPDSIIKCQTTVLCFFSDYKIQPLAYASHGHHAVCQILFHGGIPDLIQELYEITEKTPIQMTQEICLCSYETLKANRNIE